MDSLDTEQAVETKKCMQCLEVKPVTEYYKTRTGKPRTYCKVCWSKQSRAQWRRTKSKQARALRAHKDLMIEWELMEQRLIEHCIERLMIRDPDCLELMKLKVHRQTKPNMVPAPE